MSERKLGFDRATLDNKVIEETDAILTMSAVIARELVQDYPEGKAYKPAEELEKAAWTAEGRWVTTMQHPETGLLTRRSDIKGKTANVIFRKDIMDPKTKRPKVRGISANITWFKDKVPKQMLDDVKSGALKDVSIGFAYEEDWTPGEFEGEHYDFAQRNLFIDHVVAPCPIGRCPSPYCGIGVDTIIQSQRIAGDPWEVTEQYIRSGHREPGDPCRTKTLSEEQGIKAIICKYGEAWEIQSYLFDKEKWTMEKAQEWFKEHEGDAVPESIIRELKAEDDCPICEEINRLGILEASKRLAAKYGSDVVIALRMDVEEGARERAKKEQEARAFKYGITIKEGGNVTKPGEFENIPDDEFADPVNYRYPIDAEHVQAAWAYISQPNNQKAGGYSSEEWGKMQEKVKAAMKKHGYQVEGEPPVKNDDGNPSGEKPDDQTPPPKEDLPSVEDLVRKTDEILAMWKKLGERSAIFA